MDTDSSSADVPVHSLRWSFTFPRIPAFLSNTQLAGSERQGMLSAIHESSSSSATGTAPHDSAALVRSAVSLPVPMMGGCRGPFPSDPEDLEAGDKRPVRRRASLELRLGSGAVVSVPVEPSPRQEPELPVLYLTPDFQSKSVAAEVVSRLLARPGHSLHERVRSLLPMAEFLAQEPAGLQGHRQQGQLGLTRGEALQLGYQEAQDARDKRNFRRTIIILAVSLVCGAVLAGFLLLFGSGGPSSNSLSAPPPPLGPYFLFQSRRSTSFH